MAHNPSDWIQGFAAASSDSSQFTPSKVFIPGWAPVGRARDRYIRRAEYTTHAQAILAKLPYNCQRSVTAEAPGPFKFQIVFKVKGGRMGCEHVRDAINDVVQKESYKIRDCDLKASVEVSPQRRTRVRVFYANVEALKKHIDHRAIDIDERLLKVYRLEGAVLLGEFPKGSNDWKWDDALLAEAGIDKPKLLETVEQR